MREWIDEVAITFDHPIWLLEGFDAALIGVTASIEPRAVYSEGRIIEILVAEGMSVEDAWDHYGFNIQGSTPRDEGWIIVKEPE